MKEIDFIGSENVVIIESPGRINIIGEHTDYNNGFVLPTAIDKKIRFKFKKNDSLNNCSVYSKNFEAGFAINLAHIEPSENQWENYILGVLHEIQKLTDRVRGFDCVLKSDIPIGSGISSSAALECGVAFGLNELFELGFSKKTIVELSQRAEHNFVGTKCGIMDQFASVMSKKGHVILLDCRSLEYEYVPIKIEPYKILLLNTNVTHSLASSEYNNRRKECETGIAIIKQKYTEVNSLRDVSEGMLKEFQAFMPPKVFDRCTYVIEEKTRVLKAVEALKNNQLNVLGDLMYETHNGLRDLYEVSCPELDFLVDFSKKYKEIIGARMMGGGFGGCTINIIHSENVESFTLDVSKAYFDKFSKNLTTFEAMPSEGTKRINN
ncbi:MAG: galactokinase [Flavobacteria bacterium RIFCSPLOWO2_12_FULL_35_11]|nr:MAG: galactokinase [Flavobacteria bacterium RIFCSPLOWO2_12_FULL_35_11]